MKIKTRLFTILFLFQTTKSVSQVNLHDGSFKLSIPVESYIDKTTGINVKLALTYNSGNGLRVDEISSNVGTGWELTGIPKIVRIQKGEPDDQIAYNGQNNNGVNRYPNGFLYNTNSNKCPETLTYYPLYGSEGVDYNTGNLTTADTELDNFILDFPGRTISFCLDKQKFVENAENTVILFEDGKIKITYSLGINDIVGCRTQINKFTVLDENGIQYEFSERELTKNYLFDQANGTDLRIANEIPLIDNPYQINTWYISKIFDPRMLRSINFEYNTNEVVLNSVPDVQIDFKGFQFNTGFNNLEPISSDGYDLIRRKITSSVLKKDIKKINLPDQYYIDFGYLTPRKDLPESNQGTTLALSDISLFDQNQNRLSKTSLTQSFFVKNQIKTPTGTEVYSSRLCLTKIQKFGATNNDYQPAYEFDYFKGSNSTEDFVPAYSYYAKDQWGYYNGDYCGLSPALYDRDVLGYNFLEANSPALAVTLCANLALNGVIHAEDLSHEIITSVKANYAQNGLLKQIKNPFGGITLIEYSQNKTEAQQWNMAPGINNIGGVHVSKVIQKNINSSEDLITKYDYINQDGTSSLYGFEQPRFVTKKRIRYSAEGKYVIFGGCSYHFLYPGKTKQKATGNALANKILNDVVGIVVDQAATYLVTGAIDLESAIYMYLIRLVIGSTINCYYQDRPQDDAFHYTYSHQPINYKNKLPELYKRVEVSTISSNNLSNGKTVYEFTSDIDYPFIVPPNTTKIHNAYTAKPRFASRLYGLLKSKKVYDNSNTLISSSINTYSPILTSTGHPYYTKSCNCNVRKSLSVPWDEWQDYEANPPYFVEGNAEDESFPIYMEFYGINKGRVELVSNSENIYSTGSGPMTTITNYSYDQNNFMPNLISTTNSKNATIQKRVYYVEDYNLNNPANSVLNQMKNENIVNSPVSTETWQIKAGTGSTPEMISTSVNEFGAILNGSAHYMYKPIRNYVLQSDAPVSQNSIGTFNPNLLIRNPTGPPLIVPSKEVTYDSYFGDPIKAKDLIGNRTVTTIFGTPNRLPIAEVNNAIESEVAYTSFELDGGWYTGNWGAGSGGQILADASSPTGKYCYQIGNNPIISNTLIGDKEYKLTFWATTNNFTISNTVGSQISGPTIGDWTYYEIVLPVQNLRHVEIAATGNIKIDEVRLYPKNASMVTTTYNPLIGKSSECDINNRITYYEYDGLGRIVKILDEHKNIIKTFEYHFKN